MQGCECSKGMSKSETGLQSLGQGNQKGVWNGEGQAGSSMQSSENGTEVCGWMGYVVGDLRVILGHGEVWIRVPAWCYMECNSIREYIVHEMLESSRSIREAKRHNTPLEGSITSILLCGSGRDGMHAGDQS